MKSFELSTSPSFYLSTLFEERWYDTHHLQDVQRTLGRKYPWFPDPAWLRRLCAIQQGLKAHWAQFDYKSDKC